MIRVLERRRELPLLALFGSLAAAAIPAVALLGLDHLPWGVCLFRMSTGIPCLSCGATRAFGLLARFELGPAFAMNPLFTLLALGLPVIGLVDLGLWLKGLDWSLELPVSAQRSLGWTSLVALALHWAWLVAVGR